MSCPCCAIPSLALQLIVTAVALIYGKRLLLPSQRHTAIRWILTACTWIVGGLLGLLGLALIVLHNHAGLRAKGFALFCTYMGLQASPLDDYRCPLVQQHAHGAVLEFGPGPGSNFRCMHNLTTAPITNYVAVDPNPNFDAVRLEEKERLNLTFPVTTVGLRGEDVDVEPGMYDTVIGTHLLCSVDSTTSVLAAVDRALKDGGRYLFLEHVLAEDQTSMRWWQENALGSLMYILGNGCKFLNTANIVKEYFGKDDRYTINITEFQAPGVPPFLTPHILGVVNKKAIN